MTGREQWQMGPERRGHREHRDRARADETPPGPPAPTDPGQRRAQAAIGNAACRAQLPKGRRTWDNFNDQPEENT